MIYTISGFITSKKVACPTKSNEKGEKSFSRKRPITDSVTAIEIWSGLGYQEIFIFTFSCVDDLENKSKCKIYSTCT